MLRISELDSRSLNDKLAMDLVQRYGLDITIKNHTLSPFLDMVSHNLQQIRNMRKLDMTPMLGDWIGQIEDTVRNTRKTVMSDSDRSQLEQYLAFLLYEKAHFLQLAKRKGEAFGDAMQAGFEIRKIAENLKDTDILFLADMVIGDNYYVNDMHEQAVPYLEESCAYFSPDKHIHTGVFSPTRKLALVYSYLDRKEDYRRIRKKLEKDSRDVSDETALFYLEPVIRGNALVHDTKHINRAISQAENIINGKSGDGGAYRDISRVFLANAVLESGAALKNRDDRFFGHIANRGIKLSDRRAYVRHREKIRQLLSELVS